MGFLFSFRAPDSWELLLNAKKKNHYVFVKIMESTVVQTHLACYWASAPKSLWFYKLNQTNSSHVCVVEKLSECFWPPHSIQVVEVYLELRHAAWDGEGGAVLLHVLHLLLLGLLGLLLQHHRADLQQQALRGGGGGREFRHEHHTTGLLLKIFKTCKYPTQCNVLCSHRTEIHLITVLVKEAEAFITPSLLQCNNFNVLCFLLLFLL